MKKLFIGRESEIKLLRDLADRESAELVSITGRRRVGKTQLVKQVFEEELDFHLTGTQSKTMKHQLRNFAFILGEQTGLGPEQPVPKDWQEAFFTLIYHLKAQKKSEKLILFFDELPWLATPRSGFLEAFSFFWNSWAEQRNILVIICGSAASWMINKVVRNKGGLHNRITQRIQLEPFTLAETKLYLEARGFRFNIYAFTELYMVLGGIPHYLKELNPSESNAQNIDRICFNSNGLLYDEFSRLYPALFDNGERHIAVVRALASHVNGLTRKQIVEQVALSEGGSVKRLLEELEFSGFVQSYYAFGKQKKGKIYRLVDFYSLFYLRFIERQKIDGAGAWQAASQMQTYKSWRGYAFENVGLWHVPQLKAALGIASVATIASTYYQRADKRGPGVQIDLVLERADNCINLCEFKFYNDVITLTAADLDRLEERRHRFITRTGTRNVVYVTLVSPFGIHRGSNRNGVVDQSIEITELL